MFDLGMGSLFLFLLKNQYSWGVGAPQPPMAVARNFDGASTNSLAMVLPLHACGEEGGAQHRRRVELGGATKEPEWSWSI